MKISSQLLQNMASGSAATVVSMLVMGCTYPLFISYLGIELFGIWLLLSTVLAFSRLGDAGIGLATAKLVAEAKGRNDVQEIRAIFSSAVVLLATTVSVPLTILWAFPSEIISLMGVSVDHKNLLLAMLPSMSVLALLGLYGELFLAAVSGLGRADISNSYQTIGKLLMAAVSLLLLVRGWGIHSLIYGTAAMQIFWCSSALTYLWMEIGDPFAIGFGHRRMHQLLSFGGEIFAGNLLGLLLYPFSAWMLTRYAGVEALPLFDIAFRGAFQVRALLESALRTLMPEFSRQQGSGSPREQLWRLNQRITKITVGLALPLYATLGVLAPYLLGAWLGYGHSAPIVPLLRTTLLATFISLAGVPTYYLAMGLGQVRVCLRERLLNAGGSMLALTLTLFFTGGLSVQGAADAMLFSFSLSTAYLIGSTRSFLQTLKEKEKPV